ncbi:hypothetical protein BU24DRAFT_261397 [Aaosphaeria arxii CBS 175.79]|uniref:Uncharacterized protein n=1 Tax=Aaosphaeria arxii CBS 175.79 TaxID=1450172 RepID=A0A6A5XJC7_9PLEO|nr:uncharacterized protein BU24DRAFT_261397 [Aaosphaeria arxii CBS 175.79]KAF2012927.1 hypothetical protein BU24DRAFT_261397 [Aaosphaeria arxii CBS 175.79]
MAMATATFLYTIPINEFKCFLLPQKTSMSASCEINAKIKTYQDFIPLDKLCINVAVIQANALRLSPNPTVSVGIQTPNITCNQESRLSGPMKLVTDIEMIASTDRFYPAIYSLRASLFVGDSTPSDTEQRMRSSDLTFFLHTSPSYAQSKSISLTAFSCSLFLSLIAYYTTLRLLRLAVLPGWSETNTNPTQLGNRCIHSHLILSSTNTTPQLETSSQPAKLSKRTRETPSSTPLPPSLSPRQS